MQDNLSPFELRPPSGRKLLMSSLLALALAAVLLVTVILPAEYGIDPTGIGDVLGINGLSGRRTPLQVSVAGGTRTTVITNVEETVTAEADGSGYMDEPAPLEDASVHQSHTGNFKSETVEINMAADEQLEFKIVIDKDQMIAYSWEADQGVLYYDFHAEPHAGPEGYWVRYEEGDEKSSAHGSLTAPFTGQHGWYFLNYNEHPMTIRLSVSGYYRELIELGRSSVLQ